MKLLELEIRSYIIIFGVTFMIALLSGCGNTISGIAKELGVRSGRYTMFIDGGILKKIVEEVGKCEATAAENFLDQI